MRANLGIEIPWQNFSLYFWFIQFSSCSCSEISNELVPVAVFNPRLWEGGQCFYIIASGSDSCRTVTHFIPLSRNTFLSKAFPVQPHEPDIPTWWHHQLINKYTLWQPLGIDFCWQCWLFIAPLKYILCYSNNVKSTVNLYTYHSGKWHFVKIQQENVYCFVSCYLSEGHT